jgi:hypothetical protein
MLLGILVVLLDGDGGSHTAGGNLKGNANFKQCFLMILAVMK